MKRTSWVYSIIRAIDEFGGEAHISEFINSSVFRKEQNPQEKLDSAIHGMVHNYSADHASGVKNGIRRGSTRDVFEKTAPAQWKLRSYSNPFVRVALGTATASEVVEEISREIADQNKVTKFKKELHEDELIHVREHWRRRPDQNNSSIQTLAISHADASPFEGAGLRSFFEYRHLGIPKATNGAFGAHVIRAVPGDASAQEWHTHELDFQLVYVTKGWVEFEYEGHGKVILRAGSSVLQPPGIVHREVRHSDDMELLEVTSPAEFETSPAEAPK